MIELQALREGVVVSVRDRYHRQDVRLVLEEEKR